MICQASLAAGLAWFIANNLLHRPMPVFAPISAILCLGMSFGQRVTRLLEVCFGVAIGVLIGDLFVMAFGTGVWQLMLVIFVAMSVATWAHARPLMINQAGIQAATVLTLLPNPDLGTSRFLDALLGCAVAMVFALVAPTSPIQQPRLKAAAVLREVAGCLYASRDALVAHDQTDADHALARARASEGALKALSEAASEGIAVVRYSPFLWRNRGHVQEMADLVTPLDRLTRDLRVLTRRATVSVYRDEPVPEPYLQLLTQLAGEVDFCAAELAARRVPVRARPRLIALAAESSTLPASDSLSGTVILAQARAMMVDLLELTGLSYADSRAAIPDMD